jgi:hypothetical protein
MPETPDAEKQQYGPQLAGVGLTCSAFVAFVGLVVFVMAFRRSRHSGPAAPAALADSSSVKLGF